MSSCSELRARARKQLGGSIFAEAWLMTMLCYLLYSVIIGAASFTVVGVILLGGPLTYGMCRITLNNARGAKKTEITDLFDGFSKDFVNTFLLELLTSLYVFLWSLLLIIPGIIKSYAYALSFYIQNDSENKDWSYCLHKSEEMMKGHKAELFVLDLSFIGWYIVGSLCLGIGMFFVVPYHMQAKTNFYLELKEQSDAAESNHIGAEEPFNY